MSKTTDTLITPSEVRSIEVVLTQMKFGKDDWWQFHDVGEKSHQATRMEYDVYGHDVWFHDGYVEVPRDATDDERDALYVQYVEKVYNNIDPNT